MISVIITNYNKELYIEDTLNSLFQQLEKNFELIFFDDNSTDNSLNLTKLFFKKNKKKKIKILRRKNKKSKFNSYNQISAIKYSLDYCSGQYISLLDADDIFLKTKIRDLNKMIKKNKKKIFYNSYYILNNKKTYINKRHYKVRKYIWPIFPPTSCLTIEKNLFKEILNKISFKKFPSCWLDFRIAVYVSKFINSEVHYTKKIYTIYRKDNTGNDYIYNNFLNKNFWIRKIEAILATNKIYNCNKSKN